MMLSQNAGSAVPILLRCHHFLRQTRMFDKAERILNDPRIGQLFLGGAMEESAA